ncbi:MAG TPA: hypothetical protein VNJ01_01420 [Bacteriovoracaceae bacterium]|nr:hypothetical protein [Bacteriovoracaceae bacterium]
MKCLLLALALSTAAVATENDLSHRPRSFSTSAGRAVFVDFTEATYNITYDFAAKSASVLAQISFNAPEAGLPIFDSVTAPTRVLLDGAQVTATETMTPSRETSLRVINTAVSTGSHTLTVELPLTELVEFSSAGVKSAFWTSDLASRRFLERYLPANFEFDQVKMTFNVALKGATSAQNIYTNGTVSKRSSESYSISYPAYYTASSIFFHLTPASAVTETRFGLKSIDGRTVPVTIYFSKSILSGQGTMKALITQTTEVFHELEKDYGAFPHPSVIVYNAGSGGMEYCGATMTELRALGHELFHSYFARGVMPANGNSGWLDEALASWRDKGYSSIESLSGTSSMSSHPYYNRITDMQAYSFGERFMSLLDSKFKDKGGLKPFMRYMIEKRVFAPIFVEEFIAEMSKFYGVSVDADFRRYTFGSRTKSVQEKNLESAFHPKMTLKELKKHL